MWYTWWDTRDVASILLLCKLKMFNFSGEFGSTLCRDSQSALRLYWHHNILTALMSQCLSDVLVKITIAVFGSVDTQSCTTRLYTPLYYVMKWDTTRVFQHFWDFHNWTQTPQKKKTRKWLSSEQLVPSGGKTDCAYLWRKGFFLCFVETTWAS